MSIEKWIEMNAGKLKPLTTDLANELHKPIIKKFPRRKVIVYGIDGIWAADLADMQKYSKQNKHYKYLLTVIDLLLSLSITFLVPFGVRFL